MQDGYCKVEEELGRYVAGAIVRFRQFHGDILVIDVADRFRNIGVPFQLSR